MVTIGAAGADLKGVARFFFVPGGKERRARDGTQRANVLRGADATDYGRAHACPVRLSCRASTAQREERAKVASGIYLPITSQNSNDILKLPTAALLTATPQRAAVILPAEIRARRALRLAHHHKLVRAVAAPQLVGGPL